jgi:hypothetical protein
MTDVPPPAPPPPLDLSWKAMTIQWGTRAPVRKDAGLTLGAINVGAYGEVPDYWQDRSRSPRGAFNPTGAAAASIGGYYLRHKSDVWADNAAELYEEAISRRWSSADSIPWDTCRGLGEDVELAVCQVATELSQQASIEAEVISAWQQQMSYGFHEVKVFLATETFDAARHFEVFRKRALLNGGGLGLESPGEVNRWLLESRGGWTETVALLHILRGLFTRTIYRYLGAYAPSPVELHIGQRTSQDKSRHIAYGLEHLRYAVNHVRGMADHINAGLAQAELFSGRDEKDPVLWESLACIFGGGVRHMDSGMAIVRSMRRRYVTDYLQYLDWIGIHHQRMLAPNFKAVLED